MKKKKLTQKEVKEEIVANLEDCEYTRDELIEKFIEEDLDDIYNSDKDNTSFVFNILKSGWKGYDEMTLSELKEEFRERYDEEI